MTDGGYDDYDRDQRRSRSPSPNASSREEGGYYDRSPAQREDDRRGRDDDRRPESQEHHSREDRRGRDDEAASNQGKSLFITALSKQVNESDLETLFGKYGKVESVNILRDPHSRESRGFAFLSFATPEEAEAALILDGTDMSGRNIIVQKSKRSRARTPTPGQYYGPKRERRDRGGDRYERRRGPYDRGYSDYGRYPPAPRYDYPPRSYGRDYDRGYHEPAPRGYDRYPAPARSYDRDPYERRGYDDRERSRYPREERRY